MSTGFPAHSLLTRPLSAHPFRPRLHSAISNGSLFAGYPCHIPDRWSRGANWLWPASALPSASSTRDLGTRLRFGFFRDECEAGGKYWATRKIDASRKHKKRLSRALFNSFASQFRESSKPTHFQLWWKAKRIREKLLPPSRLVSSFAKPFTL